jgi:hypothetical protein
MYLEKLLGTDAEELYEDGKKAGTLGFSLVETGAGATGAMFAM